MQRLEAKLHMLYAVLRMWLSQAGYFTAKANSERKMSDVALKLEQTDVAYRDFLSCREILKPEMIEPGQAPWTLPCC